MNSAVIALVGLVWFVAAYRLYGRFIERKLIRPNDDEPTPAHHMKDGVDYQPAKPAVLFGHHFSSIAGAGPIIGPIIAAHAFGFGPSLIWILLGSVFVGAVHDYTTLMISVRNKGQSIPEITKQLVGGGARVSFQIFVLIALVFINAVFAIAAAKSFVADGRVVIPAFGLIPLAMLFGWLVNRAGLSLVAGTAMALVALAALFGLGMAFPVVLPIDDGALTMQVWIALLMLYGVIAAVLPVWILLQPRDYVASWILGLGMAAGLAGILVTHKPISAPMVTSFSSPAQGPMWPMLFILIACGAVSGFHSLVSSGTTAKQLSRESEGRVVGFGSMITEGGLALLALLAVTAGLAFTDAGDTAGGLSLSSFLAKGGGGPISAFAAGFGVFTEPFLGGAGAVFGMMMLNAFVLTTLDTSVRLSRFISVELFGPVVRPFKNRYVATILPVLAAYALAASGSQGTLWPMFGAANQLVAALAMIVASAYFVKKGRSMIYTAIPAAFMLVTTCGALVWKGYAHLTAETPNITLAVASAVLLVLAVYVGVQGVKAIRGSGPEVTENAG